MSTTSLPLPLNTEIDNSENSVKKLFKNKFTKIISLHINSIQISEFMTRGHSLNEEHIQKLMSSIQKEGYLPESSVWVNSITGANGKVIQHRLVAGRHRLEACKRLGIEKIPALIFENLTDKEECLADRISNQKDRRHKKVSTIEEARHILYLKETKNWSIREIARAKGISKSAVGRKIQIAKLSPKVQDIFVTVPRGTPELSERQLQNICKLKAEAHQVMVCHKLLGTDPAPSNNTEQAINKTITAPDLKKMVRELKILEAQGRIAEAAMKYFRDEKMVNIGSIKVTKEKTEDIITSAAEEAWMQIIENIFMEESAAREKGLKYAVIPLWLKHCTIDLPLSSFILLTELISNDLRFKPEKNTYFFITPGECYQTTEDYLAKVVKVKTKTLKKKLLPSISEYVDYRKPGDVLKFRIRWNRLFELYLKNAKTIPFNDGGLAGIPENYTGRIKITPYHSIFIENGQVKQAPTTEEKELLETEPEIEISAIKEVLPALQESIKEEIPMFRKPEQSIKTSPPANITGKDPHSGKREQENTTEEYVLSEHPVRKTLENIGMAENQIKICINKNNIETTLNIIKYIKEMKPSEKDNIKNIPGYIYGMIKKGFSPPENFETYQETEEKAIRRKTVNEVGIAVRQGFKSGRIKYFSPKPDVKIPLTDVPNEGTFIFTCDKGIQAGSFSNWPDEKYFR